VSEWRYADLVVHSHVEASSFIKTQHLNYLLIHAYIKRRSRAMQVYLLQIDEEIDVL
jgi:hypothetical protein